MQWELLTHSNKSIIGLLGSKQDPESQNPTFKTAWVHLLTDVGTWGPVTDSVYSTALLDWGSQE